MVRVPLGKGPDPKLEATRWFHPKSEDSIGDVEVDPELMELFRGYRAKATGSFVIESRNDARPDATYDHYRCQYYFVKLAEWLREKGVKSRTPLHTLRKEFGSQICDREGIYAASRALRHADITMKSEHYVDKKKQVVSGRCLRVAPFKLRTSRSTYVEGLPSPSESS
jgi:integrase